MTSAESPSVETAVGRPAPASRPPRVWKFWATLAWGVLLYVVMVASSVLGLAAVMWWEGTDLDAVLGDPRQFLDGGVVVAATTIASALPVLLTLALIIRLARQQFRDYLALRWASTWHVRMGIAALVVVMAATDAISALVGRPIVPDVLISSIRSASEHNAIAFYALALVVVAPVMEELVFRGFIYRGFAASRAGPVGAVVLTSLIFTAVHVQYDLVTLSGLMVTAFLLGVMRAVSGSTLLTMLMHAINNAFVLLEMLWFADLI